MTKLEFISSLNEKLSGLPEDEVKERLNFYSEMIEDKIEDGICEEEAIAQIGTTDEIAELIISEIPFTKIAKDKIKRKRTFKIWETVLLVLGSPIWLSLLISLFAIVFSVYIVLWTVVICLWAAFAIFVSCAFGGVFAGAVFIKNGNHQSGIALIAASLFLAGLSILTFFVCKLATKGVLLLTKKFAVWIKRCFIKKGETK